MPLTLFRLYPEEPAICRVAAMEDLSWIDARRCAITVLHFPSARTLAADEPDADSRPLDPIGAIALRLDSYFYQYIYLNDQGGCCANSTVMLRPRNNKQGPESFDGRLPKRGMYGLPNHYIFDKAGNIIL